MVKWVNDAATLREFFSLAIIYAPNFPHEDYLEPHEQLDLEKAFEEMRSGLVYFGKPSSDLRSYAEGLLEEAYRAYKKGDRLAGSNSLQLLRAALIKQKKI